MSALVETTDAAVLRLVAVAVAVAATPATALVTAVTSGTLAVLAVAGRHTAGRLAAALPAEEGQLCRLGDGAALSGGLLLLAVKLVLLQSGWKEPAHPLR